MQKPTVMFGRERFVPSSQQADLSCRAGACFDRLQQTRWRVWSKEGDLFPTILTHRLRNAQ
jgi:hypothetical protein